MNFYFSRKRRLNNLRYGVELCNVEYVQKVLDDVKKFFEPFINPDMNQNILQRMEPEYYRKLIDSHRMNLIFAVSILQLEVQTFRQKSYEVMMLTDESKKTKVWQQYLDTHVCAYKNLSSIA